MPLDSIHQPTRTQLVAAADVRLVTGYTEARDIADADLNAIILDAQTEVLRDVAMRVEALALSGAIDGANTKFYVPSTFAYRVIFNEQLDLSTGPSDVTVQLRNDATDPPTWSDATVSAVDAVHGVVTLSAAPAATIAAVELWAYVTARQLDLVQLKRAVKYLSAVGVDRRVRVRGKVLLANQEQGGGQAGGSAVEVNPGWFKLYQDAVRKLRPARPLSVSRSTRLPSGEAPPWRAYR